MVLFLKNLFTFTFAVLFIFLFAFPASANVFLDDFENFQAGDLECYGFACGEWTPDNGMAYSEYTSAYFTNGQAPLITTDTFSMQIDYRRAENSSTSVANIGIGVGQDELIGCAYSFEETWFTDFQWHTIKIRSTGNEDIFWSVDGGEETFQGDPHCIGGYTYYGIGQTSGNTESWIDNLLITDSGIAQDDYDFTTEYYTLDSDVSDYYTNIYDVCLIGEDCNISIWYNEKSIGKTVYLIYDSVGNFPSSAVASTTLESNSYLEDIIVVPDFGTSTVEAYHVYMVDAEVFDPLYQIYTIGDISKGGMKITWTTFEDYTSNINWEENVPLCDEEVVCAGIPPNKTFLYGFQCAIRLSFCWTLKPTSNSVDFFSKSVLKLQRTFPFNLAFGVIERAENSIETVASSTVGSTFGLPSYDGNEFIMINGIDKDTMSNIMSAETMQNIETKTDYFLWIIVSIIMGFIIIKFAIL